MIASSQIFQFIAALYSISMRLFTGTRERRVNVGRQISSFYIHFSYIISIFGIKRCRRLYFMKNFSRSLELSLDQALGTRVARDITVPRTFRMVHLCLDVLFTIVYRSACFL